MEQGTGRHRNDMKSVLFIADFFSDQLTGGAELNDDILIKHLQKTTQVVKIHSNHVTKKLLQMHP